MQAFEIALKDAARKSGVLFGASYTAAALPDRPLGRLYVRDVNLLVPDYELKWSAVRPSPEIFHFAPADSLFAFSQANGMAFRGVCLAWEEFNPPWMSREITSANAKKILTDHVHALVGRYAGHVHSWDVVNEPIWFEHGKKNGLRDGIWLETLGERYIDIAFRAAREADPKAMLVLNEAATETLAPSDVVRRQYFLKLIDRLLERGVPLDAVGLECHLSTQSAFDRSDFGGYLHELSARGLRILVSELDVSDLLLPATSIAERDYAVALVYDALVTTAVANRSLAAVITWELSDKSSWMRDLRRPDGTPPRPLPYDALLRPKMARAALAKAVAGSQPV